MRAVKALVPAAGLGTRLRPLTTLYPKPLIPFLGSSPLEIALGRLAKAGLHDVAVNSHYLAEQVTEALERNPFAQRLVQSHEPTLLGNGGVYNPLRGWLGDDDLLVYNGDIVSDIDVAALIKYHQEGGYVASVALLPAVVAGESAVYHRGGRVVAIGRDLPAAQISGTTPRTFSGAHVLSREFLELLPKSGAFSVIERGYQVALERGLAVGGLLHEGMWHDIRDPQFYWLALKDVMTRAGMRNFVARGAQVDDGAKVGANVVVEHGGRVEAGARVEDAVILPGAVVAKDQTVVRSIILPLPHAAIVLTR